MKATRIIILLGGLLWTQAAPALAERPAATDRLAVAFARAGSEARLPVLVYFTDKGVPGTGGLRATLDARGAQFSARALKRRAKMGRADMTFEDLPVSSDYVRRIEALGARRRQTLNWFNAASFEMTEAQAAAAADFPFVDRIDRLRARRRSPGPEAPAPAGYSPPLSPPKAHLLDYGPSLMQDSLINVPVCHDSGYSGAGVLVAMFDNGFRKGHAAFDSIISSGRLVDEWDFVSNADTVDWDAHGTGTWSEAGGYAPGQLIGPAYQASWAIYHTEDMSQEMPVEEDHWAAALQRADSIGADVVSSSLGYRVFDDTLTSYSYEDLNGSTAISSIAARHAAALGIIVCNSMANSGPSLGSLAAPADADSILSVGAVNASGTIASFSSRGPTYDGRGKPEVCAQGVSDYWASWSSLNAYGYASGTSCSTPLVAGVCALVLEAHPDWAPMQVREALMMTASRSATPDSTTYGWGIVDAWAAIHYDGSGVQGHGVTWPAGPGLQLSCRPNPVRSSATLSFVMPRSGSAVLSVYDIAGRLVRELPAVRLSAGPSRVRWDGRDRAGMAARSGVYVCRIAAAGAAASARIVLLK